MFLSKVYVFQVIEKAIIERKILSIQYQHTTDSKIVNHKIAPFDVGTTNPKYYERHKDNVYAYCYDHYDDNGKLDPKVIPFNINNFISIVETQELFDPIELTDRHRMNTENRFDYRKYKFAIAQDRNWYNN